MSAFTGTTLLTRKALRQDRVMIPIWLAVLTLLVYVSAAAVGTLYHNPAERLTAARAINANGAVVALYGPILDVNSLGELSMTKMTVLYSVFLVVLLVVVVRRHTRGEEESGRLELIGGTAVSPSAPLVSALIEGLSLSIVAGALAALAAMAGKLPVIGSLGFGATWLGIGVFATGLTALTSQLSASARTCAAITAGVLGALYVLRAIGDISVHWLSWASPFGWNTQLRAWSQPRWWVLALYLVTTLVLVAGAVILRQRRDLGSGLIAARRGPAVGSPRLADALALCLRVNAALLVTWTLAAAAVGALFGAIAPGFANLLDTGNAREMIQRIGGGGAAVDSLVAAVLSIVAIIHTYFAISVLAHTGTDETAGRAETVLATGTSRSRWYWSAVLVALAGTLWLLFVTGVFLIGGYGFAGSAPGSHPTRILPGALAWTPAVWLVAALAAGLLAVRKAVLGWAIPALCLVVTLVGDLLRAPSWMRGISPYSHIPLLPSDHFRMLPGVVLLLLTGAVLLMAARWFRHRDIG